MDVTTVSVTADEVTCETDHMTSFAILMSSERLPEVHEKILLGITYVLCSLSIIGLLMSLIGLSVFRYIIRLDSNPPIRLDSNRSSCKRQSCWKGGS